MVNTTIFFVQTACIIPQAILVYRGRDMILPKRYFDLGKLGPFVNGFAVAWVVFLDVLYCFPTVRPVTPQNMSYVTVVVSGLLAFVVIFWFTGKKGKFAGPHINLDLMNGRRQAALEGTIVGVETQDYETGAAKGSK